MLEANKALTAVASMLAGYFGGGGGVEEEGRIDGEEAKHHFRLAWWVGFGWWAKNK